MDFIVLLGTFQIAAFQTLSFPLNTIGNGKLTTYQGSPFGKSGWVNCFCKGLDTKYFRLPWLYSLDCNYSTLLMEHTGPTDIGMGGCESLKLFTNVSVGWICSVNCNFPILF
jgi:hypothetical protein